MKAKIIGIDGSAKGDVELPRTFETAYKPKLIKRAVLAMQTTQKQAKGTAPRAGLQNTAQYVGTRDQPTPKRTINTDMARLPRLKNRRELLYGRVGRVPQSVGGRRAHGPKAITTIIEKINKKERKQALESAIAATKLKELVEKRFIFEKELPIIVEDKFEEINKTKTIVEILGKLGVGKDLENAKGKIRNRAGKGKLRGRRKKVKKSVLIVTGNNVNALRASRNLPGVDAVTATSLNVELLAPGAEAGRLVVWTKGAIEVLLEKENKEGKGTKKIKKEKTKTSTKKIKTIRGKEKKVARKAKAAKKAIKKTVSAKEEKSEAHTEHKKETHKVEQKKAEKEEKKEKKVVKKVKKKKWF